MTDINLLPGEEFAKKPLGKFLTWILTYGRYIIIGTEIIVLLAFLSRFKFDRDLTDLHQSIAQKQAIILAAADFETEVRSLQNRLQIAKTLNQQRQIPQKLLQVLAQVTPEDVTLSNFALDGNRLSLIAVAVSNDGFRQFLNNLAGSSYFADISLDNVNKRSGETGIEFKINTTLKNL